jgi:hypothetical protein
MIRSRCIVILFALLCMAPYCNAQTEQQSMILGGSLGLNYNQQDSFHTTTFTFSPTFGYFVVKNLVLGASIGIGTTSDNKAKGRKSRFFLNTTFIPFIRYYFLKEKFRPFIYAKFGYVNSTSLINGGSANVDGITGGGGIGFVYFASKQVGIETTIGYTGQKLQKQNLNSTIGFGVGLQYYFHPHVKNLPKT